MFFPQLRDISKLFSIFMCNDLTKILPLNPLMATRLNYCNSDLVWLPQGSLCSRAAFISTFIPWNKLMFTVYHRVLSTYRVSGRL